MLSALLPLACLPTPCHHPLSGGTFAEIRILPLPDALDVEGKEPDVPMLHQLASRCRVDIKKV